MKLMLGHRGTTLDRVLGKQRNADFPVPSFVLIGPPPFVLRLRVACRLSAERLMTAGALAIVTGAVGFEAVRTDRQVFVFVHL